MKKQNGRKKKRIKSFLQIQFVTLLLHVFIFYFTVVWIEVACVPILNDNENCACHTIRIDFQGAMNKQTEWERWWRRKKIA